MEAIRSPYQGVLNILRFNWPFYVGAVISILILTVVSFFIDPPYAMLVILIASLAFISICISLAVSAYVYDASNLYKLAWMLPLSGDVLNISAGFDETSEIIVLKFPGINLFKGDFYDPEKHTEPSIRRARALYPVLPGTIRFETGNLPFHQSEFDVILIVFALHEVRNRDEQLCFLLELARILKPSGKIQVVEHLRDLPNFIAFNIGFLHFYSRKHWQLQFSRANLLHNEYKVNRFVSSFILSKNGASS